MKIKFFIIIFILIILVCLFVFSKKEIIDIETIKKCDLQYLTIPRSKINMCITYPNPPELLLQNTKFINIKSLLSWSIIYDCKNIFYYLIDNGVDVNSVCGGTCGAEKKICYLGNGFTPLYYAIHTNRLDYIGSLLNASASLEYLGGHFDENKEMISTKTYFDVAYNKQNIGAFCEMYKYLIKTNLDYIKKNVIEILDDDFDFKLKFLNECKPHSRKGGIY